MNARKFGTIFLIALMMFSAVGVFALPQMPHQFYGAVTIDGVAAPDGTVVEAKIGGVTYGDSTTSAGLYGWDPVFPVTADDPDTGTVEGGVNGDSVAFYVGGILAVSYTYLSGGVAEVDLAVSTDVVLFDIPLFMGWNLVSLPYTPEDPSIEVVLSEIIDYVVAVWAFDGETKTWSSYSSGAPSNLNEMVEDRGYWIKLNTDAILTIYGQSEGIVTEVDSESGTSGFIYSTDEYQIAVYMPTYLEVSMPYSKSASEIDVYLKPLVSLSGLFSVNVETGIKIKIPALSIWVFLDVDVSYFGNDRPDIFEKEWRIYGLTTALNLEGGDLGIYSISIPTESGTVSLESLPVGEWSYVTSYSVYTVLESTGISLGLTAEDVTTGPIE